MIVSCSDVTYKHARDFGTTSRQYSDCQVKTARAHQTLIANEREGKLLSFKSGRNSNVVGRNCLAGLRD